MVLKSTEDGRQTVPHVRGVGRGGQGVFPPMAARPNFFSHNNGSLQMPPGLPEVIMGSYYYQRCCNLLQMHRPTQRSQELRQKNQLNSTEITPEGRVPNNSLLYWILITVMSWEFVSVKNRFSSRFLSAPTRGSARGPRWGLCPQTPVIGSRSALAIAWPPPWADFIRG